MKKRRKFEYPKDPVIHVGFDAEWVFKSPGKNRILSYQFALLSGASGPHYNEESYILSKKHPRITLGHGLSRLFHKAQNEKVIDHIPTSIDLVAHFTRADLSTLDDFEDLRRQAEAIRRHLRDDDDPYRDKRRVASGHGSLQRPHHRYHAGFTGRHLAG